MNHLKAPKHAQTFSRGYSLLELVTVVAGISILAAVAIPNIIKYLNYIQTEEAKAILNAAAAECLQKWRSAPTGTAASSLSPSTSLQSVKNPYSVRTTSNTCSELELIHSGNSLPTFGIKLEGGRVFKSSAANSVSTQEYCEGWGNCQIDKPDEPDPPIYTNADLNLISCLSKQRICESDLKNEINSAISSGSSKALTTKAWQGNCGLPQGTSNPCTCSKAVWVCKGSVYYNESDYNRCTLTAPAPTASMQAAAAGNPFYTTSGFYWIDGVQVDECRYKYEQWKATTGKSESYAQSPSSATTNTKCLRNIPSAYKCKTSATNWKIIEGSSTQAEGLTCLP